MYKDEEAKDANRYEENKVSDVYEDEVKVSDRYKEKKKQARYVVEHFH